MNRIITFAFTWCDVRGLLALCFIHLSLSSHLTAQERATDTSALAVTATKIEKLDSPNSGTIPRHGQEVPELRSFDQELIELMTQHEIPGAAVAVTDQSRLVFARSYGWADHEAGEPVEPTSLFRIASVSKPITAIAISQLIERQQLTLQTRVWPLLERELKARERDLAGSNTQGHTPDDWDSRWSDVTVEQLLTHHGGWDRDASFDPMFRSAQFAKHLGIAAPAQPWDIIRLMQNQALDFEPGQRYAYSNFGYCLLGRLIEIASGQTYEAYVQQQVLAPLGIVRMQIGATRLAQRAAGEVKYYSQGHASSVFDADLGQQTPWPYGGWCLEAMDAHGGWIASAIDLVRLAAAFDDPAHCQLLKTESIEQMRRRPSRPVDATDSSRKKLSPVYYSLGWQIRDLGNGRYNQWHNGSLDGTTALLIRRHDSKNFAILLNTRDSKTDESLAAAVDTLLHRAAAKVTKWPKHDLFSEYGFDAPLSTR